MRSIFSSSSNSHSHSSKSSSTGNVLSTASDHSMGNKKSSLMNMVTTSSNINPLSSSQQSGHSSNAAGSETVHDQKTLIEADKLVKEIQLFLDGISTHNNTSKSNQSVLDKLRNINKKGSAVQTNHKVLTDKLTQSESRLQKISEDAAEQRKKLTNNASEFYYKLQTCIDYSIDNIPKRKEDLEFLSVLFTEIIAWMQYLQAMIKFHQEIIHQEQYAMYVPRMFNTSDSSSTARVPSSTSREREEDMLMISKLTRLKKLHKKVNKYLQRVSKSVEDQTSNLASLEQSKIKLAQLLCKRLKVDIKNLEVELNKIVSEELRTNINTNSSNPSANLSKPQQQTHQYHQSHCNDCSQTNMSSIECVVQLEAYERQSVAVAGRMTDLGNLKRKMEDILPSLQVQQQE